MNIQNNLKSVPPVTSSGSVTGGILDASMVSEALSAIADPAVRQGSPNAEAISLPPVERHPFEPFLPENAKVLMLGSFPPQSKRWSMEFYYPNFINDMWRILGLIFFNDRNRFVDVASKKFKLKEIVAFCTKTGLAMYDTATAIRRLKDNASDKFLEVVTPTDIPALLMKISKCQAIVTTGEKATSTLCQTFGTDAPATGEYSEFNFENRLMRLYRMPSSSRAYPLSLDRKASAYRRLFSDLGMV